MAAVEERIVDRALLRLMRGMLRAGVMEDGRVERRSTGTPQGGVLSPLLANVYLHRLDRTWQKRGVGRLVRYADDLVVLCRTEAEAQQALVMLAEVLAELGLELKEAKTRIVHMAVGGEGMDFLGFAPPQHRNYNRRFRRINTSGLMSVRSAGFRILIEMLRFWGGSAPKFAVHHQHTQHIHHHPSAQQ